MSQGEYLLNKTKIEVDSKDIEVSELLPYEKQTPNKTILGVKFHLFLYNLAKPGKNKGFSGWFKKIGEEPVVWSPLLSERTTEQFKSYLQTKGYYESIVTDSIALKNQKAKVIYSIVLNEPYRIRNISYRFEDQDISDLILSDTMNCLIKSGDRFDKGILQQERQRIEELMKNNGYYKFSKEYIFFDATEVANTKLVDLKIVIRENVMGLPDPETKVKHHNRYKINTTYMYPNFSLYSANDKMNEQLEDTIDIEDNHIIFTDKLRIRPEVIMWPNRSKPGDLYRIDDVKNSYRNYSSLGLYRVINIHFKEPEYIVSDTGNFRYIDGYIELTPRKIQAYQYEIVGTNTLGDFGARVNIFYNNYNLLRGAENLQIRLTGAVEGMKRYKSPNPMWEGGIEAILSVPKILVPFRARQFTMRFNPKTLFNISYNYQDHPDYYIRTIASTSLSYKIKGNQFNSHQFFPVEFSYVLLPGGIKNKELRKDIMGSSQEKSFVDHTILDTRYTFEYSTQVVEKKGNFVYFRSNLESAGNIIYAFSQLTSSENDTTFIKVPYFRYVKCDFDFRFNEQIRQGNRLVYRIFVGVGHPLGNQKVLPFEKMYFAGGPNGIRAWQSAELGPGSDTTNKDSLQFVDKLGDVKLEANLEYRFPLFWKIEGALFVDAGNIWTIYEADNRPGMSFAWNRFYKEIAVGTGLGFRFDLSFLIIRTDFGWKMRDPFIINGSRWIDLNRSVKYSFDDRFTFQFGIGYPF